MSVEDMNKIGRCADHGPDWVEDCGDCAAAAAAMESQLDQLHAEVKQRSTGLQKNGVPAQALQGLLLETKVEIIWNEMFTGRMAFLAEALLGEGCIAKMKAIQEQLGQQQGGLVTPPKPGLHVVQRNKG